jgi:hypothetical protein
VRWGRKAAGLIKFPVDPELENLSPSEKDSRAAEYDIVKVIARVVGLFILGQLEGYSNDHKIDL